ncbi:MAG: hypothetical protein AAFR39_03420 [Pseudomonadota bacterium]
MMKKQRHKLAFALVACLAFAPGGSMANELLLAQSGSCQAAGNRVAAQNGATLVSAQEVNSGGRAVCRVVILKPAQGGQRPKRETIEVPK